MNAARNSKKSREGDEAAPSADVPTAMLRTNPSSARGTNRERPPAALGPESHAHAQPDKPAHRVGAVAFDGVAHDEPPRRAQFVADAPEALRSGEQHELLAAHPVERKRAGRLHRGRDGKADAFAEHALLGKAPRRGAHGPDRAHRHVVAALVGRLRDAELRLRTALPVLRDGLHHQPRRRVHAHVDGLLLAARIGGHLLGQPVQRRHDGPQPPGKVCASAREPDVSAHAVEQLAAELRLQLLHAVAQGGLGNAHPLRACGHVLRLRDVEEIPQLLQFHEAPPACNINNE